MHNEQIFTPSYIVETMLDEIGYIPSWGDEEKSAIRKHHIIDNSCGDGAFLTEIMRRYIIEAIHHGFTDNEILYAELETYIHGIEIDPELVAATKKRLDGVLTEFIDPQYIYRPINWDIQQADALTVHDYDGRMSYVVGNPPYCNVHDFGDKYEHYKTFEFAQGGMTDLYLLFFEAGFRMLEWEGKMSYITPSSWLTSVAGRPLRKYISEKKNLELFITCGHEQVFEEATTYTVISQFANCKHSERLEWCTLYNEAEKHQTTISDCMVDGKFYIADKEDVELLRKSLAKPDKRLYNVKNGFATLNDKLFMGQPWVLGYIPTGMTFMVKSSTAKSTIGCFPYHIETGKPMEWEELDKATQSWLLNNAKDLKVDTSRDKWWLYGRTQAINDVRYMRLSVSSLIKVKDDDTGDTPATKEVWKGMGVYGGLYIMVDREAASEIDSESTEETLLAFTQYMVGTPRFRKFVRLLGHYKNGGYYTFTSKELESYLNNNFRDAVDGYTHADGSQENEACNIKGNS